MSFFQIDLVVIIQNFSKGDYLLNQVVHLIFDSKSVSDLHFRRASSLDLESPCTVCFLSNRKKYCVARIVNPFEVEGDIFDLIGSCRI